MYRDWETCGFNKEVTTSIRYKSDRVNYGWVCEDWMITKRDKGESSRDRGELGETRENVGEKQITWDNCIERCRNFQATQLQSRYVLLLLDLISVQHPNSTTFATEPLLQLWEQYQEPYFTTTQESIYMVNCYPFSYRLSRYVFADDLREDNIKNILKYGVDAGQGELVRVLSTRKCTSGFN